MPYNYINKKADPLYPLMNLQDERILVEFNGIIVSEAEIIFYGMEGCPIMEAHPFNTYDRLKNLPQDKVYEEIAYFRPYDLVHYLNDGAEIEYDEITSIITYARYNYKYTNFTYLAMAEAIKSLFSADFVKGITFIMQNSRDIELDVLYNLFGETAMEKCNILKIDHNDNTVEAIKDEILTYSTSKHPYTMLITNEYQAIIDICKNFKEYNASTMAYLLRNHSQNMEQSIKDESVFFIEKYNDKINLAMYGDLDKENYSNLDYPVKSKFARFAPNPFIADSPTFMMFGGVITNETEPI